MQRGGGCSINNWGDLRAFVFAHLVWWFEGSVKKLVCIWELSLSFGEPEAAQNLPHPMGSYFQSLSTIVCDLK